MIRVFGSINLDLVARVPRLPRAGETLHGHAFAMSPGGKGANQALAARRAGANVQLVGAVGNDAFAEPALALLRRDRVGLDAVRSVEAPTGVALIHVDDAGENAITIVAGANAHVHADQVPADSLDRDTLLVLQLETPPVESLDIARRARERGARVLLNAAPALALDAQWWRALDVLVVNEQEAAQIAHAIGIAEAAEGFASDMAARFRLATVVTLGARGAVACVDGTRYRVPALRVQSIDTVGAGDAFVGALAASLDRRAAWPAALAFASAAGSLACTLPGAQASLPDAQAIAAQSAALESAVDIRA